MRRLRAARTRPPAAGFEALHLVDADGPEECHAFLEQSYSAAGLYNLFNVPSYFDYLTSSLDLTATYSAHKRQLQLLQWRMPQPRWALKYPNHVIASTRYETPVNPNLVGAQMVDFVARHIERILRFCETAAAGTVTHVDYYRLVDNPAEVMEDVHASLGLETPPVVRDAVMDWHRRNPKNARGANAYSLQMYGLQEEAVAERFAAYSRRFNIPRERDGLR